MRIALIAHDKKKPEMIELSIKYKDILSKHELFATGTTGTLVMGETGLKINRLKSGPLGGDQQIGSMIADSQLDLVIFLRDPLTAQPHEPDVSALLRLCDVTKIPLATNITSAEIMLNALEKGWIECRKVNKETLSVIKEGEEILKNTASKGYSSIKDQETALKK